MRFGKKPDPMRWFKERVSDHKGKGKKWATLCTPFFEKPLVLLTDPQLLNEFFLKEKEIAHRKDFQKDPPLIRLGFFYKNDPHALKMRGAFTEIFRNENLKELVHGVTQIVQKNIEAIKIREKLISKEKGVNVKEYADVNLEAVNHSKF